ncbi:hypothetical protein HaLaN_16016 [Haematococcus lacustris]|uniref:Uncharacterized protein n=1 Tax=Haematococcus lacustris TaxID=44745 RepID=A0A699ZJA5_HAELA|nr:hypothetical protein HaLaN_16016 [Haematococcus lacustris]
MSAHHIAITRSEGALASRPGEHLGGWWLEDCAAGRVPDLSKAPSAAIQPRTMMPLQPCWACHRSFTKQWTWPYHARDTAGQPVQGEVDGGRGGLERDKGFKGIP